MFWRREIESKYNTCDVRCLATKIDGNSIFNKNTRFCCYGNRLSLWIFKVGIQLLKPITKYQEIVIWHDTSKVDNIALEWIVTGGWGIFWGEIFRKFR